MENEVDELGGNKVNQPNKKMAVIAKCAYDRGKASICVEEVEVSADGKTRMAGQMRQVVLSADDVIKIIDAKNSTQNVYQLPNRGIIT